MRGITACGPLLVFLVFQAGMVDDYVGPDCTEFFAGEHALCSYGPVRVHTCRRLRRAPNCARMSWVAHRVA